MPFMPQVLLPSWNKGPEILSVECVSEDVTNTWAFLWEVLWRMLLQGPLSEKCYFLSKSLGDAKGYLTSEMGPVWYEIPIF